MKPLNSGHLRVLKNLSVIKRCPLLGGSLTKIVTFETKHFVCYSRHVRYLGCPLLGGFAVITIKKNFLTYTEQQNGSVQLTIKFYTPFVIVDLSPFFLNFEIFSFNMIDFLLQVFFCYFDTSLEVIHFLFQTVGFLHSRWRVSNDNIF